MFAVKRLWNHMFLEDRPSIGLSFFRIFAALTVGLHVIPSFFSLPDNYFATALKTLDLHFFAPGFLGLVQQSPDGLVVFFVNLFCASWFFFLIGLFSRASCIVMTACCYYFYALNSFHVGTLSWDILLVTLFLLCLTPYHGDYFSVDCLRSGDPSAYRRRRPFFIQGLLQMQLAFSYFYTGLYKVTAAGNWLTGNPMHYLMNYPVAGVMKTFLLKDFLAVHPGLCYLLGLSVVGVELFLPFLLYYPKTRMSAVYLGFLFHLMLVLTMDVPAIFFFLYPAQFLLFIPPENVVRWIENKRRFNQKAGPSILVYDGNCSFCQASVKQLKVMDLFDTLEPVDYRKTADLKDLHPRLAREEAHSRLHLVEPDGELYGGFEAFRRMCLNLPMLYPLLLLVYFPGAGLIGPAVYRWVSRNRYLFHFRKNCKDNACVLSRLRNILILSLFLMASPAAAQEKGAGAREYNGVMIYRLPYGQKIDTINAKLYPHYMPLRAKRGWTYAFIDLGYKLTNPVMIEEIPGKADALIGRQPFSETVYIALKGKGYTEIRKDPKTPGTGIYWGEGDAFTVPYGYWVGHANPSGQPARLLSVGVSITNDLLDPNIEMEADRPKLPYVLNLLPHEQADIDAGKVKPGTQGKPSRKTLKPLEEVKGSTVYRTVWGTPVDLNALKTSTHHFSERAAAGWTSAHVELGGKILNWFVVQDMPPRTIETGHKHGGEVVFLGLKGRGTMAFREEENSPETKIYWGPGDLFCLPWVPNGEIWHIHSNPYAEPARFLASVHELWGRELLNPFLGQQRKSYGIRRAIARIFGKARQP